jgi:glutamate-1-semialdehyde 2,1-aminomutase
MFGVTPDLCSLGKGMANGYPISVVAGRADIMKLMEEIFFSFTMGGEAISLAAANAVIEKIRAKDTLTAIAAQGETLQAGLQGMIAKHGLGDVMSVSGDPSW